MKNLKKLGKVLGKKEQKSINGGLRNADACNTASDCTEVALFACCEGGMCIYYYTDLFGDGCNVNSFVD